MRAYMSKGMTGLRFQENYPSLASLCAEDEAQRILLDTEPMRPGYRWADRCYLGAIANPWFPDDAGEALADALEAFVATDLECPHEPIQGWPENMREHMRYCWREGLTAGAGG